MLENTLNELVALAFIHKLLISLALRESLSTLLYCDEPRWRVYIYFCHDSAFVACSLARLVCLDVSQLDRQRGVEVFPIHNSGDGA